jgi:hypothetical protein
MVSGIFLLQNGYPKDVLIPMIFIFFQTSNYSNTVSIKETVRPWIPQIKNYQLCLPKFSKPTPALRFENVFEAMGVP